MPRSAGRPATGPQLALGTPILTRTGATGWPAVALLAAAILGTYLSAAGAGYLFDDHRVIVHDVRVHDFAAWMDDAFSGIRPLLKLSYLLNWRSGLGERGYLAVNLALHLGNALLLWQVCRCLLQRLGTFAAGIRDGAALLCALLFALHPAQTEAVTYFSGRSMSLMALFWLTACLLWLKAEARPHFHWLSLLAFLAALATRETAIILPVAMAWTILLSPTPVVAQWRVPFASLAVCALLVAAIAIGGDHGYTHFLAGAFSNGSSLEHVPDALRGLHYLANRSFGLQRASIDPVIDADSAWWWPLLIATAAVVLFVRRQALGPMGNVLLFSIGWWLLQLMPMYSLVPRAELANDRHLYLALAGPMLALATGSMLLAERCRHWRVVVTVAVACLLAASSWATWQRNQVLHDEIRAWRDVVIQAPGHARGWHNLGSSHERCGHNDAAIAGYCMAQRLQPNRFSQAALADLGIGQCPVATRIEDLPSGCR